MNAKKQEITNRANLGKEFQQYILAIPLIWTTLSCKKTVSHCKVLLSNASLKINTIESEKSIYETPPLESRRNVVCNSPTYIYFGIKLV